MDWFHCSGTTADARITRHVGFGGLPRLRWHSPGCQTGTVALYTNALFNYPQLPTAESAGAPVRPTAPTKW